jgi:monoamine oxidase
MAYERTDELDMASVPLDLTADERRLGFDRFDEKYVGGPLKTLGNLEAAAWPPPDVADLDRLTIGEYLRNCGASPDASAYLALGFEKWSALDGLRDATHHHTKTLSKIRGGNDLLPRAFAARLSDVIRYGSPVVSIRQDATGVEAVVEPLAGGRETVRGDAMVCTIPFTVLRAIPVSPEWTADKRRAIDTLATGCVLRVELQTRTRLWEDRGENGFATVDQPLEIWSPTWNQPGRRGILQAYVYEDLARKVCAGSEADRIRFALDVMEPVHPGLASSYEGGVAKCWDEDPWARGAYTLYRPGEITGGLHQVIDRAEGRIHFAGEHASPYPGWMQGAFWSAHRAAAAVLEAGA